MGEKSTTIAAATAEMKESHRGGECSSDADTFEVNVNCNGTQQVRGDSKQLKGMELRAGYWIFYYHPAFGCTDDVSGDYSSSACVWNEFSFSS